MPRIRPSLVVIVALALGALAGCDADRLPQSPNALSPSADRKPITTVSDAPRLDRAHDRAEYVQADPF